MKCCGHSFYISSLLSMYTSGNKDDDGFSFFFFTFSSGIDFFFFFLSVVAL